MVFFTSNREMWYWVGAELVLFSILITLLKSKPFTLFINSHEQLASVFMLSLGMIGISIFLYGLQPKHKFEILLSLGLLAIFILLFIRLNVSERSHLLEYGILTIFIHEAFTERKKIKPNVIPLILKTIFVAIPIGLIDELSQLYIPYRVFDMYDIYFNVLAVLSVLCFGLVFTFFRKFVIK